MNKPTVRDIHEIVMGLHNIAGSLREGAEGTPIQGQKTHMVATQVKGLLEMAASLDLYATALNELIPEDEVEVEPT